MDDRLMWKSVKEAVPTNQLLESIWERLQHRLGDIEDTLQEGGIDLGRDQEVVRDQEIIDITKGISKFELI